MLVGLRLLLFFLMSATPLLAAASQECSDLTPLDAKKHMTQLEGEIRVHNGLYYKDLRPSISDLQYDRLFAELVRLEQCFPALAAADSPTHSVASDSSPNTLSLRHEHPMLSLNSSTGPEAIELLWQRAAAKEKKPRLLVQPKVDGLPVELIYHSGRLVSASTRGDGQLGADVTERVKEIPGIPKKLLGGYPASVTVRGEIYAERGLMANALRGGMQKYATPRHFAAATLKSQDPDPLAVAALRLFPFELVDAEKGTGASSDLASLGMLFLWGLPVRLELTRQVQSLEEIREAYEKCLAERGELPFTADGIVVKVDDLSLRRMLGEGSRAPFWAAAWKFPPETVRTTVRAIRWKTGRTGRATPVIEVLPVNVGGVRVSHVSLNNAETARRLRIAVGDRVVVALVADIIPQVLTVERRQDSAAGPDATSAEATQSGEAACLSDAPGCREQFVARTVHFVSRAGLNIPGFGSGRVRKLVEAGLIRDLPSLFRLKPAEIAAVKGFGQESARRLMAALRQRNRPEPYRLLTALGIPGVGPTAARRLAKEFGSLDALLFPPQRETNGYVAVQNVRRFFDSPQGRELLKGLREAGLL